MFTRNRLACSFCGKSAAEVSKLVAGPKVFICDACAALANRIMSDPSVGGAMEVQSPPSLWRRITTWLGHRGTTRSALEAS